MIFSLLKSAGPSPIQDLPQTDIFCFFSVPGSISLPMNCWPRAVAASLKIKKNVLIIERSGVEFLVPADTKRFVCGEGYLWLTPRFLKEFWPLAKDLSDAYLDLKVILQERAMP
jgi:hypothetical protein